MECDRHIFFHYGPAFALLPHYWPKNWNLKKYKKTPGDILLHMCTIDEDHMMHGSWDIRHNRQNILFWVIFCPLTLLANQKIKIWKKNEKRAWRYHHFTQLYQKYSDIGRIADVIVIFHFFAFYSLTARKIKIWKKRKTHQEVSWFYKSVPKIMIIRYNYSEIWCVTDVIVIFHFGLFFAILLP